MRYNGDMKKQCLLAGAVLFAAMAFGEECARFGFDTVIIPRANAKSLRNTDGIKIIGADTLPEALGNIFGWGRSKN